MAVDGAFGTVGVGISPLQMRQDNLIQSGGVTTEHAKIDKGAKEFEAVLLGSWLQQAEQSFATIPGADDDDQDGGKDQMVSMGVQSLATSMVASGGLGISRIVAKAMHRIADRQDTAATPSGTEASSESPHSPYKETH